MRWWHRWTDRLPEHARERVQAFAGFVWHRFNEDRCFESAAVLAYGSILAIVPLLAAALGIASSFPVFGEWRDALSDFLFANFVPEAARQVQDYLLRFADAASHLTLAGVVGVLLSALIIMSAVEDTFNRIWRVEAPRPLLTRFLVYWTTLTLGPVLMIASMALSQSLFDWSRSIGVSGWARSGLLQLVPLVVELAGFSLAYSIIPNRPVAWRHALIGGVLATVLFELAKSGFGLYLREVPSYQQIYGALAVLPIFLIWVFLSWAVLLLGASIAASLSAFRFRPPPLRLPPGHELYAALRLAGRLLEAQRRGEALSIQDLREREPGIDDDLLLAQLNAFEAAGIVQRNEAGCPLLARDPAHLRLAEIYEATAARIPLAAAALPGAGDPCGRPAATLLQDLREPLAARLDRNLAALFAPEDQARSEE